MYEKHPQSLLVTANASEIHKHISLFKYFTFSYPTPLN